MDDQVDMRLLKIEQYALENRAEIQALQEEVKELKNKLKELIKINNSKIKIKLFFAKYFVY